MVANDATLVGTVLRSIDQSVDRGCWRCERNKQQLRVEHSTVVIGHLYPTNSSYKQHHKILEVSPCMYTCRAYCVLKLKRTACSSEFPRKANYFPVLGIVYGQTPALPIEALRLCAHKQP